MSWILAGIYCGILWLVFVKLRLIKLSLPLAIVAASVGPGLIVALLFCAQYFHLYTAQARVFQKVVPIIPQLKQAGRVTEIMVTPNKPVKLGDAMFRVDPVPYENAVNRLTAMVEETNQGKKVAEASIELGKATLARANADLDLATTDRDRNARLFEKEAASKQDYDRSVTRYAEALAAVNQANASLTQAVLSVDLAAARIDQAQQQLAEAKYDLEQTTVNCADGWLCDELAIAKRDVSWRPRGKCRDELRRGQKCRESGGGCGCLWSEEFPANQTRPICGSRSAQLSRRDPDWTGDRYDRYHRGRTVDCIGADSG